MQEKKDYNAAIYARLSKEDEKIDSLKWILAVFDLSFSSVGSIHQSLAKLQGI